MKDKNYHNETECMEGVLKSEDEEDAPVMYEDPSKLKVVADNINWKVHVKFIWTGLK